MIYLIYGKEREREREDKSSWNECECVHGTSLYNVHHLYSVHTHLYN
jgi:hypothetical protein